MEIKIKYDNENEYAAPIVKVATIAEEEWQVMVETDFEKRRKAAAPDEVVERRSPQEIMENEFNKPLYNDWHREHRRRSKFPKPNFMDAGDADTSDGSELIEDKAYAEERAAWHDHEALCQQIHEALPDKPEWADAVIAIYLDGDTVQGYAAQHGESANNISQKLRRAKKKLQNFFAKRHI